MANSILAEIMQGSIEALLEKGCTVSDIRLTLDVYKKAYPKDVKRMLFAKAFETILREYENAEEKN